MLIVLAKDCKLFLSKTYLPGMAHDLRPNDLFDADGVQKRAFPGGQLRTEQRRTRNGVKGGRKGRNQARRSPEVMQK
jgi:hypothetical protein